MHIFILDHDTYYLDYLCTGLKAFPKVSIYPFNNENGFFQKFLECCYQKQKNICVLEASIQEHWNFNTVLERVQKHLNAQNISPPQILHIQLKKPDSCLKEVLEKRQAQYYGQYLHLQEILNNNLHRFSTAQQIYTHLQKHFDAFETEPNSRCLLYLESLEKEHSLVLENLIQNYAPDEKVYVLDFREIFSSSHTEEESFIFDNQLFDFLSTFQRYAHEGKAKDLENYFEKRQTNLLYYRFPQQAAHQFNQIEFKLFLKNFTLSLKNNTSPASFWFILLPSYLASTVEPLLKELNYLILNMPQQKEAQKSFQKQIFSILPLLSKNCEILNYQERENYV